MQLPAEWLFLLLGIPAGVIATRLDFLLVGSWNRIRFGRLNVVGCWAEYVPASEGRQYSLGEIKYDFFRKRYTFNGTNYRNSGEPFCHWKTVSSHIDRENGVFHYVFLTTQVNSLQSMSYGFGVVQLIERRKECVPEDGYYIYADNNRKAISVSHTMKRIEKLPESRAENISALLDQIFTAERSNNENLALD